VANSSLRIQRRRIPVLLRRQGPGPGATSIPSFLFVSFFLAIANGLLAFLVPFFVLVGVWVSAATCSRGRVRISPRLANRAFFCSNAASLIGCVFFAPARFLDFAEWERRVWRASSSDDAELFLSSCGKYSLVGMVNCLLVLA
jgi:hypothetical protein